MPPRRGGSVSTSLPRTCERCQCEYRRPSNAHRASGECLVMSKRRELLESNLLPIDEESAFVQNLLRVLLPEERLPTHRTRFRDQRPVDHYSDYYKRTGKLRTEAEAISQQWAPSWCVMFAQALELIPGKPTSYWLQQSESRADLFRKLDGDAYAQRMMASVHLLGGAKAVRQMLLNALGKTSGLR